MALKPKDLTLNALQGLIASDVSYPEIMEMYSFNSDRYFKEVLKTLGYRLLRGKLWVLADELWLNKSSLPKIRNEVRNHLTDEEKQTCADLHKEGKTTAEIVEITGIPYHFVYKWADVETYRKNNAMYQRRLNEKRYKRKAIVEPARIMPPTNPPGEITHIHADIDQVERHLQELLGDRLSPVVCSLAERRPVMRFTSQDKLS